MAFDQDYDPREAIRYVDEFMFAFRSKNIENMKCLIEDHPGLVEYHAVEEILPMAYSLLLNKGPNHQKLLYDTVINSGLDNKKEIVRAFENIDRIHNFNVEFGKEIPLTERKMSGFKRR